MQTTPITLGIDIGSTNCYVFFANREHLFPQCVTFANGGRSLFSTLTYQDGSPELKIGVHSSMEVKKESVYVVKNFVKLLGLPYHSEVVQLYVERCGVPVIEKDGFPLLSIPSIDVKLRPVDAVTELLKTILRTAEEQAGNPVEKIILTIPPGLSEEQRGAMKEAAREVGFVFPQFHMIDEAVAVALSVGLHRNEDQTRVLVYDFGANSLHISVLLLFQGSFSTEFYLEDPQLSGHLLDVELLHYIESRYSEVLQENSALLSTPVLRKRYSQQLLRLVEKARIELSVKKSTMLDLSFLFLEQLDSEDSTNESDRSYIEIHVEEFNSLIQDRMVASIRRIKELLEQYSLTVHDIDYVLPVGGVSATPLVQYYLRYGFGSKRLIINESPEERSAFGACLAVSGKYNLQKHSPYSIGLLVEEKNVRCIIPCGIPLPVSKSIVTCTSVDYMKKAITGIYKSTCDKIGKIEPVTSCIKLKELTFEGFNCRRKGEVKLVISLQLSDNDVLLFSATEQETGKILVETSIICQ